MNGKQVAALIGQRWEILNRLLGISRLQMAAIEQGQMSDSVSYTHLTLPTILLV